MSEPNNDLRFWDFEFGLEVSALYHDWRRAALEQSVKIVRSIALAGAIIALLFWTGGADSPVVAVSNVIIAAVVLADLVFGFGESARQHTDLYRRFNAVQEKIARHREDSSARLAEWEAEVVEIRRDEPPVLWAVYATCWNQVIERRQADRSHLRKIEWYQRLLRNFLQFRPIDFPLGAN